LKQLPAVTNNSGQTKFQRTGPDVNTCLLSQTANHPCPGTGVRRRQSRPRQRAVTTTAP